MSFFLFIFFLLGDKTSLSAPSFDEFLYRYPRESLASYEAPLQAAPPAAGGLAHGAYSAEPPESHGIHKYSLDYQPPPPFGHSQQPTQEHHLQQSQAQPNPSVFQHSDAMLLPNDAEVPGGDQSDMRDAAAIPHKHLLTHPASPDQFGSYPLVPAIQDFSSLSAELDHDSNPAPWLKEFFDDPNNLFPLNNHNQHPFDGHPLPLKESFMAHHQWPQLQHQQPEHFPGYLAYSSSHPSSSSSDTTNPLMKLSSHASQNNEIEFLSSEQAENSEVQRSKQDSQATPSNPLNQKIRRLVRYEIYPDQNQSRKRKHTDTLESLELKAPKECAPLRWINESLKSTKIAVRCDNNDIMKKFAEVAGKMPCLAADFASKEWPESAGSFIHQEWGLDILVVRLIGERSRKVLSTCSTIKQNLGLFLNILKLYSGFIFAYLQHKSQANIPDYINQRMFLEWVSKAIFGDPQNETFKIPIVGRFSKALLPPTNQDCYHPAQSTIIRALVIIKPHKYLQASIALLNHWFKTHDPMTWHQYFKTDKQYLKFLHDGISEFKN